MAGVDTLLADINLRYRNTFTTAQKLVWLNEEQRELFDILEIDSAPYAFETVENNAFYPFPENFDPTKIKVVTYQMNDNGTFQEIRSLRNDDNQYADQSSHWYSLISDGLFLNIPGGAVNGRTVYIYCDEDPTEITENNISSPPELPIKYQEILKLGVLERIAAARKDVVMKNNYAVDKQEKTDNLIWQKKMQEPEWTTPIDDMPYRAGSIGYRRWC